MAVLDGRVRDEFRLGHVSASTHKNGCWDSPRTRPSKTATLASVLSHTTDDSSRTRPSKTATPVSGCLGLATHTAVLDGYSRECPQSHN